MTANTELRELSFMLDRLKWLQEQRGETLTALRAIIDSAPDHNAPAPPEALRLKAECDRYNAEIKTLHDQWDDKADRFTGNLGAQMADDAERFLRWRTE